MTTYSTAECQASPTGANPAGPNPYTPYISLSIAPNRQEKIPFAQRAVTHAVLTTEQKKRTREGGSLRAS